MKIAKNLHWLVCILFFFCCAKQSAPTGGPKDTIPPGLVSSIPQKEAINFKGKTIEMTFSEMIVLNNPKEQLIITPTIGKDYEIKARKNSVIIALDKTLEDSTTYTFNFRDAIQDITEKNPVRNFQFALSTGQYIDSLSIEGSVFDIIQGVEKEDVTVAIHQKNDTFSILKHPAVYFTKTNKKGIFRIDHLKPDTYYIYAIADKNRNLFADSKNESYGFLSDSIRLQQDTANIAIGMLNLDARPLKLISARPYNSYFNIRTSKNIKDFKLFAEDSTDLYYSFGEDQSNIKVYNNFQETDSTAIRLTAVDSIDNWLDTTVYAKFPERDVTPEKFDLNITQSSVLPDKGIIHATIKFTKPVREVNFDSMYYEVDSLRKIHFVKQDLSWDQLHNVLTIKKTVDRTLILTEKEEPPRGGPGAPVKPDTLAKQEPKGPKIKNQLYSGKATFISIESDSSKKIIEKITPFKTEDLSEIHFDIKANHKNIIVQLLENSSKKVIREKAYILKGKFEDLESGDYIVRVVVDSNHNGIWDPGNYFKKQEPEKIIYYRDDKKATRINLKPNWELELAPMLITY